MILVPVAAIMDAAGIPIHAGRQGVHPAGWLVAGPLETLLSAVVLFAADALAQRMGVSLLKRFLLAAASATALWNVTVRWGHPEDAVAVGLLLYGVLALSNGRPDRAAWLAGAGGGGPAARAAGLPIAAGGGRTEAAARLRGPCRHSRPRAAGRRRRGELDGHHPRGHQPAQRAEHRPSHPWIYLTVLAPHLSNGSVAAGPARALAILVACGCALATWRRWRPARLGDWSPEILAGLLWWVALALALRSVFEPVMVSYYVWPPLAVALVAAARTVSRLLPAGVTAGVLTFLSQSSWRNPLLWWTPMVAVLGLTLLFAWPWAVRSAAAQVLPEPGEQFAADRAP